jgi:hypothetical protein
MNVHAVSQNYRRYALALLLAVNLLNYIDRQVLYAVFPLIKADLAGAQTFGGCAPRFLSLLVPWRLRHFSVSSVPDSLPPTWQMPISIPRRFGGAL